MVDNSRKRRKLFRIGFACIDNNHVARRVWVPVGLEARSWGFDVTFLLSFGFFGCSFSFFLFFVLFWCPFCILHVCLGALLRFFNAICLPIKKKDNNHVALGYSLSAMCSGRGIRGCFCYLNLGYIA
jgi:hypothetical protein